VYRRGGTSVHGRAAGEGRGRSRGGPDRLGRTVQRFEGDVECAVELALLGDGLREFRLHAGALAAREVAAPQLGPQLLDITTTTQRLILTRIQ
jgi:hypothetical protein